MVRWFRQRRFPARASLLLLKFRTVGDLTGKQTLTLYRRFRSPGTLPGWIPWISNVSA